MIFGVTNELKLKSNSEPMKPLACARRLRVAAAAAAGHGRWTALRRRLAAGPGRARRRRCAPDEASWAV